MALYCISIVATFASKVGLVAIRGSSGNILVNYISPTIVLASIGLLGCFAQIDVAPQYAAVIRRFSELSFGVYLVHCHPLIFEHLLKDRFIFIAESNPLIVTVLIILSAVGIYLTCTGLEFLRSLLFKVIRINDVVCVCVGKLQGLIEHFAVKLGKSMDVSK